MILLEWVLLHILGYGDRTVISALIKGIKRPP